MDGHSKLIDIARQIKAGERPRATTVKGLLNWFGSYRRGKQLSNQIAAMMSQLGITTDPDFMTTPSIDDKIRFTAVPARQDCTSEPATELATNNSDHEKLAPVAIHRLDAPIDGEANADSESEIEDTDEGVDKQPDERPVVSKPNDWNISVLSDWYDRGDLDLQPSFQREYVWNNKPELRSRLIESLLLEIPIPPIYLGQETGGRLEVIDGQQRLTTLIHFVRNGFRLQHLAGITSLNDKYYKDLSKEQQRKINSSTIRTVTIDAGTNTNLRYEIFERLNRGAVPLKEQEIRNCIFRGAFRDLLRELEGWDVWRRVKGTEKPESRFLEREQILRFFTFAERIEHYNGKLKQFLTKSMQEFSESCERDPTKMDQLRTTFMQTIQNVYTVFSENAARVYRVLVKPDPPPGQWEAKFSVAAFDIQASALLGQPPAKVQILQEQIREAYLRFLLTDPRVMDAISGQGTTRREPTRLRWFGFKPDVDAILSSAEARFFSYELRKELFEKSDVCQLCKNQIHKFDDCTVDSRDTV